MWEGYMGFKLLDRVEEGTWLDTLHLLDAVHDVEEMVAPNC
jgi:hypothetical protein